MTGSSPVPDSRLRFDPVSSGLTEFSRDFFRRDTVCVARDIIGAWFARRYRGQWYGARIVETEAYLGAADAAAHSWRGRRTPRVEPMYRDGGYLYVFLVYGIHSCANIVTRPAGIAEAVLLRAAEGPDSDKRLLSGPGKLCAALGVTTAASGIDLLSRGEIRLFHGPPRNRAIGTSKRIGVDYAGDAAKWPLRFFDIDSACVSGPGKRGRALK
ncbi:MAG: DNA-3-methyladenine glycosylase [Syntrophaceae bacterium]|nr:DNA-3-methyladenine glycosylase [Syntrophaceae bacterium]